MSIARPPGHDNGNSNSSSTRGMSRRTLVLIVVAVILIASGLAGVLLGAGLLSIVSIVAGAFSGVFAGFRAVGHLFSAALFTPIAFSGVLGALAAAVIVWLAGVFK